MSYEKEECRLEALLQDVLSDEESPQASSDSETESDVETESLASDRNTDREEDLSDRESIAMKLIEPCLRDRRTQLKLPKLMTERLSEILKIDEFGPAGPLHKG
ncbi:hypothetical protein EVAR_6846_1 [Eumeta japonica]|uniref:Uncharacterized protein n=1 Tax=Eumeta variegata TaxID=151549 RepID=A0A4C1U7F3_EUMVA|nr:hypothetical protein EVAR_6846_1 [Eumeta japonica]